MCPRKADLARQIAPYQRCGRRGCSVPIFGRQVELRDICGYHGKSPIPTILKGDMGALGPPNGRIRRCLAGILT